MMYRLRGWILWAASRLVTFGLFEHLEVEGRLPRGSRPQLVVANHFNGLVDVVLLIVALGEYPQFIAKSTLFERWPARLLLKAVGAIPVYRPMDGADSANNVGVFDRVYDVWRKGRVVAIFPEGTVAEEERLQPLRTGAARLALGARDRNIDLDVLPVGITYLDKAATRSRGLVEIGEPIRVEALPHPAELSEGAAGAGSTELADSGHLEVRWLTDVLADRISTLPAMYGNLQRKARLLRVADVVRSSEEEHAYRNPPMSALIETADRIARLPEDQQIAIIDHMGRYHLDLVSMGIRDDHLVPEVRLRDLIRRFAITALTVLVVLPLAYFSFLTNVLPLVLTILVGTAVREPVTKGTARVLVALVAFPAAWAFALWTSSLTGWWVIVEGLALALGSVFIVIGVASVLDAIDAGLGWWRTWSRAAMVAQVRTTREEVVDYVRSALG